MAMIFQPVGLVAPQYIIDCYARFSQFIRKRLRHEAIAARMVLDTPRFSRGCLTEVEIILMIVHRKKISFRESKFINSCAAIRCWLNAIRSWSLVCPIIFLPPGPPVLLTRISDGLVQVCCVHPPTFLCDHSYLPQPIDAAVPNLPAGSNVFEGVLPAWREDILLRHIVRTCARQTSQFLCSLRTPAHAFLLDLLLTYW